MAETIKCLILILFSQNVCSHTVMPVLVLDPLAALRSGVVSSHPFHETTSNSFTEVIHDAVHLSESILIFVEEKFSVEDISTRDSCGTPYENLHKNFLDNKAKYMPNVVEPLRTLQQLLPPLESNIVHVRDSVKSFDKKFKYHYIYFIDPQPTGFNETRVQMLRRHDKLMDEAYEKLRADHTGPLIMFYTGKTNPMKGVGRTGYERPDPSPSTDGMLMVTDSALIRLTGVVLQQQSSRTLQLPTSVSAQRFARTRLATRMTYSDFALDFNFEYHSSNWLLDSVVLLEGGEEVGRTPMGVGAPYGFSYFCSEPLVVVNTRDKSYVTIAKYQLEPLYGRRRANLREDDDPPEEGDPAPEADPPAGGADEAGKTSFTNTVNCGTNFNCRILAGLFVAGMVISITLYGIMMMYDCASNDRMDDANQKPLVIVAQL